MGLSHANPTGKGVCLGVQHLIIKYYLTADASLPNPIVLGCLLQGAVQALKFTT